MPRTGSGSCIPPCQHGPVHADGGRGGSGLICLLQACHKAEAASACRFQRMLLHRHCALHSLWIFERGRRGGTPCSNNGQPNILLYVFLLPKLRLGPLRHTLLARSALFYVHSIYQCFDLSRCIQAFCALLSQCCPCPSMHSTPWSLVCRCNSVARAPLCFGRSFLCISELNILLRYRICAFCVVRASYSSPAMFSSCQGRLQITDVVANCLQKHVCSINPVARRNVTRKFTNPPSTKRRILSKQLQCTAEVAEASMVSAPSANTLTIKVGNDEVPPPPSRLILAPGTMYLFVIQ